MKRIKIANAQAFWGDRVDAPIKLVKNDDIDYLTLDYLAELTMSIMKKQQMKNEQEGYARDFVQLMKTILPVCLEKNIKVVTNAGGINPESCRQQLIQVGKDLGLTNLKIGVVSGDDLFDSVHDIHENHQIPFVNLETNQPFSEVSERIASANAYFGAFYIAKALEEGADIVVTGRCTDPSLTLGPLIYEFGWSEEDYDLLAAGTIAGHIIECGAQATGGNFQGGWEDIEDLVNIGYPIVEMESNGDFIITKQKNSGGLVNRATVTEQLLYEIGDPKNYLSPDVIVDFTNIELSEEGNHRVRVVGAKGRKPTDLLKVSMSYEDGYITQGMLSYGWPNPVKKAKKADEIIRERIKELQLDFEEIHSDYIGVNGVHGPLSPRMEQEPVDCVFRIAVRSNNKQDHIRFGMELAPLILGPAGLTGFVGGRPKPSKIVAYWPTLIPKQLVDIQVSVEGVEGVCQQNNS